MAITMMYRWLKTPSFLGYTPRSQLVNSSITESRSLQGYRLKLLVLFQGMILYELICCPSAITSKVIFSKQLLYLGQGSCSPRIKYASSGSKLTVNSELHAVSDHIHSGCCGMIYDKAISDTHPAKKNIYWFNKRVILRAPNIYISQWTIKESINSTFFNSFTMISCHQHISTTVWKWNSPLLLLLPL